jgi:hypothetical protein
MRDANTTIEEITIMPITTVKKEEKPRSMFILVELPLINAISLFFRIGPLCCRVGGGGTNEARRVVE